jgi:hypothetical protein
MDPKHAPTPALPPNKERIKHIYDQTTKYVESVAKQYSPGARMDIMVATNWDILRYLFYHGPYDDKFHDRVSNVMGLAKQLDWN